MAYYDLLNHQQPRIKEPTPQAPAPKITDLQHGIVRYDPAWYCAHPRWGLFQSFGSGEIIAGFKMAPCAYQEIADIKHGSVSSPGYESRATIILQRSLDGGQTWPRANDVVLYREGISDDEKRAFLYQQEAPRASYDMFAPASVFWFTHTFLHDEQRMVCFGLRSADKGRTWEKVPTVVAPPPGKPALRWKFHQVVRRPDGRTLISVFNDGASPIYRSTDQGLTWEYLSHSAVDPTGVGAFTYDALLQFPNGDLQCYQAYFGDGSATRDFTRNRITMSSSADGGLTWTTPIPIVAGSSACWNFTPTRTGREEALYRSPYPILLQDGRILVVWARRQAPFGIGGVVSEDGGQTWSPEFIIRADDLGSWDHGYAVGGQLDDGRIFIAYYYNEPDKEYVASVRYIASSTFRLA